MKANLQNPIPTEDNTGAIESIRRFLKWKAGEFGLLVVACNDAATRDNTIRELGKSLPGTQLRIALPDDTVDPLEVPLQTIHGEPPAALHIVQLERSVPSDESKLAPLHALNLRRGQWEKLGCPVIFWVPEYLLGLLLRHAPDFSSWRSGSPQVSKAVAPAAIVPVSSSIGSSEDELYRPPFSDANLRPIRLAELKQRLGPYPGEVPPAALNWLREAALLHALEKQPDAALSCAKRYGAALQPSQLNDRLDFLTLLSIALARSGSFSAAQHAAEDLIAMAAAHSAESRWRQREGWGYVVAGNVAFDSADYQKALAKYERALEIAREIGDKHGESNALGSLGNVHSNSGNIHKAIDYYKQCLELHREISDQRGEIADLGNLGIAYAALGDARKAIGYYKKQLEISRKIGDRRGESNSLGNIGTALFSLGDALKAIGYHEQQLLISREIGDRRGEGTALGNIGNAYSDLGDDRKAIEYFEQALAISREIGDRRAEGHDLGNLGISHKKLGGTSKAISYYEQRLKIAREIGDRHGESNALGNLGNVHADLGDARKAIKYYEEALIIDHELGDRRGEGTDLWNSALAHNTLGERAEAIRRAEASLAIHETIEDPFTENVRRTLAEWKNSPATSQ